MSPDDQAVFDWLRRVRTVAFRGGRAAWHMGNPTRRNLEKWMDQDMTPGDERGRACVSGHDAHRAHTEGLRPLPTTVAWRQHSQISAATGVGHQRRPSSRARVCVLAQGRANGKGIIGMKILGQGDMRTRQDEALKFALSLGILDAFTIGAENAAEQDDLLRRIAAVNV